MTELKPCPFCGNEAEIHSWYIKGVANRLHYRARCKSCGCECRNNLGYRTAKKATEIWNRRKLIDKIVEQLENLEKRNRELEDAIERDGNEIVELANENRRLRMTLEIVKGGGMDE